MTGRIYSERLGAISDAQFAEATRRLGLGDFLSAEPVAAGLFGQNVFIATTTGQFVLRGAPHWVPVKRGDGTMQWERDDRVQFAKEAFFIRETHAHTAAPVPWPCHRGHLIAWMTDMVRGEEARKVIAGTDLDWMAQLADAAMRLPARPVTFTHADYKLDNMTLAERDGAWRVSGLFDFHTARFGDGAHDLIRPACAYLDTEPDLASTLVEAWREAGGDDDGLAAWLPLYVASERVGIWCGFVRADARPEWSVGHTFRSWAERYLEHLSALF